jgi:cell division protein ZapA (FtsZ GTPase activity inhibitor)
LKRTVNVTILNKSYPIKTSLSDEEISEIEAILNQKMEEIKQFGGTVTTPKLAILAALEVTAENYFISKKIDKLINKISEVC